MDVGEPIREIEVIPKHIPVPEKQPAVEPTPVPEKVPAKNVEVHRIYASGVVE